MLDPFWLSFSKLTVDDLPLMLKWLNSAFVGKWYGKGEYTYRDIKAKYVSRISGESPTNCYLIHYAKQPIGFIQTYRIVDYPDYNQFVQSGGETAGVDMFLGEDEYAYQGLGTAALFRFLKEIVFKKDRISSCVMGPDPENKAAIRAYKKLGFQYYKTIHQPDGDEYLMRIDRVDL